MIRGIYTATTSLLTLEAKQGVITNNLSNVITPGFKKDELIVSQFDSVMLANKDRNNGAINVIGEISNGSIIDSTKTQFVQGSIKETEKSTDFALDGPGFFAVRSGDDSLYTRDGSFIVDIEGNFRTKSGAYVMGTNLQTGAYEPINVGESQEISIDSLNTLNLDGLPRYRMNIVNFTDYNTLQKVSNNLYTGEGAYETLTTRAINGALETSTVNASEEMVDLTNTLRSFESSMKILGYLDESLRISANEIGKI